MKCNTTFAKVCLGLLTVGLSILAPAARADYAVLQTGERIHITGYEILGDNVRLTMVGGTLEIPSNAVVRVDPEDTFTPIKIRQMDVPFANLITTSAQAHGVDAELVASVIAVESNFKPNAVSWKSARGLMQLMPDTAARFGVKNVFDPAQNIEAGTRYLKELLLRYKGDLNLTLAAYNAGPQRVEQYQSIPPYRETIDYVHRVIEKYRQSRAPASEVALR